MNWYKIAQTTEELMSSYQSLQQNNQVNITGTGQSESINLPNGQNIIAGDLLRQALSKIQNILVQNGVREIDTSPISQANAQGLAVSHEPGKIHISIQDIFNNARQSLPSITQLDGVNVDPDMINNIVNQISQYLLSEIGETISHESFHVNQYQESLNQQGRFDAPENPAEQYGQKIRQQYFNQPS